MSHFTFHIGGFAFALSADSVLRIRSFAAGETAENDALFLSALLLLEPSAEKHLVLIGSRAAGEGRFELILPEVEDEISFGDDFWRDLPILPRLARSRFLDRAAFYENDLICRINTDPLYEYISLKRVSLD